MVQRKFVWLCMPLMLLCFVACTAANAQVANNTSLVGTVTDPGGNAIAGAKVTATNEGTGVAYPGTTNGDGYYSVDFILAGVYDIVVEHPGFTKTLQKGIVVQSNQAVRTDIALKVGEVRDVARNTRRPVHH